MKLRKVEQQTKKQMDARDLLMEDIRVGHMKDLKHRYDQNHFYFYFIFI